MMLLRCFTFAVLVFLCATKARSASCADGICAVSALALVANPTAFEGKVVSFLGVLSIEREGVNIYPTPWHRDCGDIQSAVLIRPEKKERVVGLEKYDGKVVWVVGRFTAKRLYRNGAGLIVELDRIAQP